MAFNKISVIGLGYIGLPTAAVIASRGVDVVGVDVSPTTVDIINRGEVHIVEPDLDIVVRGAVSTGRLRATLEPEPADAFMVAVPTPLIDGQKPDLNYIKAAAHAIAPVLAKGNLVILESTSPVGATEMLAQWLAEARTDLSFPQQAGSDADVKIAHCPERVLPGRVLHELVDNDRIIGGLTEKCAEVAQSLYSIFVRGECLITNARTAELSKLTENSFRDVNIAFANELSIICDRLKINVWELIRLANRHPRVNVLNPGPGVGGHCIAVDPWFIVSSAPEEAKLIRLARETNDHKPKYVLEKIVKAADEFKRPVIACFGLAFKPDIDDLRESPAMEITESLADLNAAKVLVVEPNISEIPKNLAEQNVELVSAQDALEQANVVVILVDHKQFKRIPKDAFNTKVVIDTRGVIF